MATRLLVLLLALGFAADAGAGVLGTTQQAESQTWSAWGGELGLQWNTDLLRSLGLSLQAPTAPLAKTDIRHHHWFAVSQSAGLHFLVTNDALRAITGGSLQMRGGYVLSLRDGSTIDLRNLTLRPRDGNARTLDLVGSDGKVWFYSDHVMFKLVDNGQKLQIESADIRVTPQLASRLGTPEAANWSVAGLAMDTQVYIRGAGISGDSCDQSSPSYPWPDHAVPGAPGQVYQADLFMLTFDAQFERCNGCDGSGGSDGSIVFAPDSSLKNNVNNGSAQATIPGDPLGTSAALYAGNIAWNEKFSGSPPGYNQPYKNDQHPFLIWNMYRVDADGSIEQIGRSGVKHAFLTVNYACQGTCYDGNSLGRGCEDTYGTYNNDNSSDLGPRSEIVPAQGIWGRCGSIWDPDCTGDYHNNGNGSYDDRLVTHESQIDPAANTGASYMFESWYLARQDINILNSMATLSVTQHYNSGSNSWSLSNQSSYRLGPAIDRWVDPADPGPNQASSELGNDEGHAKLAVKVTDLGNGTWRYDYAVMNLDFARAETESPENGPDPRVVGNHGFDSFSIPISSDVNVVTTSFHDGNLESDDDWVTDTSEIGEVRWYAGEFTASPPGHPPPPIAHNTLDWGTLYSFSITVDAPPTAGRGTLHVAKIGTPADYDLDTLVPTPTEPADTVFRNGFDGTP